MWWSANLGGQRQAVPEVGLIWQPGEAHLASVRVGLGTGMRLGLQRRGSQHKHFDGEDTSRHQMEILTVVLIRFSVVSYPDTCWCPVALFSLELLAMQGPRFALISKPLIS